MDPNTRMGPPAAYPHNPDAFEHFNVHATRMLEFHRYDCHHGIFRFPVSRSPWFVWATLSAPRDLHSFRSTPRE
jgi:hypothetical protein